MWPGRSVPRTLCDSFFDNAAYLRQPTVAKNFLLGKAPENRRVRLTFSSLTGSMTTPCSEAVYPTAIIGATSKEGLPATACCVYTTLRVASRDK